MRQIYLINTLIRQYMPYYILQWYYIIFNMFRLRYRHHQRTDFPHSTLIQVKREQKLYMMPLYSPLDQQGNIFSDRHILMYLICNINVGIVYRGRIRWSCDLRSSFAAAWLLGQQFRIPLRAWMLGVLIVCSVGSWSLRRAQRNTQTRPFTQELYFTTKTILKTIKSMNKVVPTAPVKHKCTFSFRFNTF